MRSCTAILLLILVLLAASSARVSARTTYPVEHWQVSVLTFGPGPVIYERYGHVAIRLKNSRRDLDVCYDWGNFSFEDPNFLGRFFMGDLRYWMQGKYTAEMLPHYIDDKDRTVVEQVLNLTPEQSDRLRSIIQAQDTEATRYYLYDYFKDNCATRVRDVIDEAVGHAMRERAANEFTPHSYRWHNRRLVAVGSVNTVLATVMDFAFGPRNDLPLSRWDAAFLPGLLAAELDATTVSDGSGGTRPLVRERRVLHETSTPANAEPEQAFNPAWLTLPAGLIGCGALIALARMWPLGFKIGATLWELFVLLGAIFMTSLIGFTRHWVLAWNENLLQFTPLALLVMLAIWSRRLRRWLAWSTAAALGLSLLCGVIAMSTLTPQRTVAALLLAVPMHAAVFFGLRRLSKLDADKASPPVSLQGTAP